jgi:hypothetical protein
MTRELGSSSPQSKTAERHGVSPPASLAALLGEFRGCFSAWTYPVFCALACGLLSQRARRPGSPRVARALGQLLGELAAGAPAHLAGDKRPISYQMAG